MSSTVSPRHPTVSVLVLNYNGKQHLESCLRSLVEINYPGDRLEIVLVDNGSSDGSQELVRRRFPSVRLLEHGENLGFSRGNNLAAAAVDSEYVAFLNNDTRVDRDWLRQAVDALDPDSGSIAVGSRILSWDGKKLDFVGPRLTFYGIANQVDFRSREIDRYREVMPILAPCGGSMLIDRSVFLQSAGFDEDYFAFFEDTDLGWRLWVLGYRAVLAPGSITYHRQHGYWGKRSLEVKKRVFYDRNALYSVVKNYEEENLRRVFPAALLLTVKRALVASWIDRDSYRLVGGGTTYEGARSTLIPDYTEETTLASKLHRSWAEGGVSGTANKVLRRLSNTALKAIGKSLPLAETEVVPREAVSHLVALEDLTFNLQRMLKKRDRIQTARRRPDSQIIPLFLDPFWPVAKNPDYLRCVEQLVRDFDVDSIFEGSGGAGSGRS